MAKESAGSNRLFVNASNVSGNVSALSSIEARRELLDVTDITQTGRDRKGLLSDGTMVVNGWWDGTVGATPPAVHDVFKTAGGLVGAVVSYWTGITVGVPVACLVADQANYNPVRSPDGSLAWTVSAEASAGAGLEWAYALTTANQTFASTGYGSDADDLAGTPTSTAYGAILYVHLISIASGNITISAVEGASAAPTTAIAGCTTTLLTTAGAYRLPSTSATATIRRYTRLYATGTFSNAVIAAALVRPIGPQA
jgi:hypothetical protein